MKRSAFLKRMAFAALATAFFEAPSFEAMIPSQAPARESPPRGPG